MYELAGHIPAYGDTEAGRRQMRINYKLCMKKLVFLILITIIAVSCNKGKSSIEKILYGQWSIDTVYYMKANVIYCFNGNIIDFAGKSEEVFIPGVFGCGKYLASKKETASYDISLSKINKNFGINIKSKNIILNGLHKLRFKKDNVNKLLKLELKSDNLFLVCRKGYFDFDENIDKINYLTKITNP